MHGIFNLTFSMQQHSSSEVTVTKYDNILRGEKLNYNSCTSLLLRKSQNLLFLAPEVQWTSKCKVFVRFTFPLTVSNHVHIWCVT